MPQRDSVSGFAMEPSGGARQNGYSHCSSMIHPSTVESSLNKTVSTLNKSELSTQKSHKPQAGADFFISSNKKDERVYIRDSRMVRN